MSIALEGLASSAALYPFALDLPRARIFLTRFGEEEYRSASFLDERLDPRGGWVDLASVAQAMSGARDIRRLHFIFHAGHVGSTLLSRLLDEADGVLSLREPLALRTLCDAHDAGAARSGDALELFLRLWERGFARTGTVVLKATSTAQRLSVELLRLRPQARAVMLNVSAETYLATMLAGENSATDLNAQGAERMNRLSALLGQPSPRPTTLSELAAMSWAAEKLTQARAMQALDARVLALDFDALLNSLDDSFERVSSHFGLSHPPPKEAVRTLLSRYSKAPEHPYSPETRRALLAQARDQFAQEIRQGLVWLEVLRRNHPALQTVF